MSPTLALQWNKTLLVLWEQRLCTTIGLAEKARNWALSELDFSAPDLILDADEVIPEDLRAELMAITERHSNKLKNQVFTSTADLV